MFSLTIALFCPSMAIGYAQHTDRSDRDRHVELISENSLATCMPQFTDENAYTRHANVKFDKTLITELNESIQDCGSYQVGKRIKFSKEEDGLSYKVSASPQDCHLQCYTHPLCAAFSWNKHKRCRLLKNIGGKIVGGAIYVTGMRDDCTDKISNEARNYFSNPFLWQDVVKNQFLETKQSYDGSTVSRKAYSRMTECLKPLIKFGAISEEEMGIAPALKDGIEVPFLPLGEAKATSLTVDITANSGQINKGSIPGINPKIQYENWIFTGLYAPPGKIISVVIPEWALYKFQIQIGVHTDKNYGKDKMLRDPDITSIFSMGKETQKIGSPYGGLIIIKFFDNSLEGEVIKMKFENVLKAPHFVLGKHTNEDWNSHIKNEAGPWTVFEIPNKIGFVVPSRGERGAYHLTDVTFNLKEWSSFMDKNDKAVGIVNRPAGELVVLDSQIIAGSAHNGYPIMKVRVKNIQRIFPGFPGTQSINFDKFNVGLGHEIGHNMQLSAYMMSHMMVNIIFYYALPETRKHAQKGGTWGRKSRIFGWIKAGKPNGLPVQNLDSDEDEGSYEHVVDNNNDDDDEESDPPGYTLMADIIKLPFDGPDGSGWKNDGSWDDLPAIYAPYREIPAELKPTTLKEKYDLWVKNYCNVKKMNMLSYFDFWKIPVTDATRNICQKYSAEPTEIMSWISNIESMVNAENACSGEGWFGNSKKCFKRSDKGFQGFTLQKAKKYCKKLDGSTGVASVTSEDEAILLDYAFIFLGNTISQWGFLVESVANLSEVFPYVKDYIREPENQGITISKVGARCSYMGTIKAIDCNKDKKVGCNTDCIGPIKRKMKMFALCEKIL